MRGRPLKTSTVWKLVRAKVAAMEPGCESLCMGLKEVLHDGRLRTSRYLELRSEIRGMLNGCPSYEAWMVRYHRKLFNETQFGTKRFMAKDARLAWLDHLIAEAKAKGD